MKHFLLLIFILTFSRLVLAQEEVLYYEGFENGRPLGWTEIVTAGPAVEWRYRNGGHNPNDPNNLIPDADIDNGRNPDRAYHGTFNAYFQKESDNNERTMLVTCAIDLEYAIKPELRFWHAQVPWTWSGQTKWDQLRVFYRTSATDQWVLLAEFPDAFDTWTQHIIPLPNPSKTYYLAFEGQTRWGHGVVLDEVEVIETGVLERKVESLTINQANTEFVLTGSENNEVLQIRVKVNGNSGDMKLKSLKVNSLNTSDNDIITGGVKLFRTISESFSPVSQIGAGTSFVDGEAVFTNIDAILPTGVTYLWVTFDVDESALHNNRIDGYFNASSIEIGNSFFPGSAASPAGSRPVQATIFYDNFDVDRGWTLTHEFEIAAPLGGGATPGGPNPSVAYNGSRVLGTDVTGLEDPKFKYRTGIPEEDTTQHYLAISPSLDLFYYKNVVLRFRQWLNVSLWDGAYIELSNDGGSSWLKVWRNNNFVLDDSWVQKSYPISAMADRKGDIRIRFGIGETTSSYTGWNIDNFAVTGEYITRDMGVAEWLGPFGDCRMSTAETVRVRVANFAAIATEDPIPVEYSIDNGVSWIREEITASIPVGGSLEYSFVTKADFSVPGIYKVRVRTRYSGDQEAANDEIKADILSVPVYELPYKEDFEGESSIFWRKAGTNVSWELGEPAGEVITGAGEGSHAWVTNASGLYSQDENSWVEGPCFDLSGHAHPVFEMQTWWHTPGPDDRAAVLISKDGRLTWEMLGTEGLGDEYSWNWYNSANGWSGESDIWHTSRFLLSEYVGEADVCFRIEFKSAPGVKTHEGFAFDNVQLYNIPPDVGVTDILNLSSGCAYALPVRPEVVVKNFGLEALEAGTDILIGLDINGVNRLIESFILQNELPANGSVNFRFAGSIDMSDEGIFELASYTLLEGDIDFYNEGHTNDTSWLTLTFTPIPVVDLGKDIYTVLPDTVVINAYAGIDGYDFMWHDGSIESFFNVSAEGKFTVTVTDAAGCFAIDSVSVHRLIADIGVTELVSPHSSCELGPEEGVTVKIENFGTDTLNVNDQFLIFISVDEGPETGETVTLPEVLLPGAFMEYTFIRTFDFTTAGTYGIKVRVTLDNDNDATNDLLETGFEVFGYPALDLGPDINIPAWEYTVDAGGGLAAYQWHDASSEQTFTVTEPGINELSVTVTDHNNCQSTDEITVFLEVHDLSPDSLISPAKSCGITEEVSVSVLIKNSGNVPLEAGQPFTVGYSIDNGALVTEEKVLNSALEPEGTVVVDFTGTIGLEEGTWYNFSVFVTMPGDMRQHNDTIISDVGIFEPPVIDLGPDVVIQSLTYLVDAGPGFESYLWHDESTEQTYTASIMGINNISVTVTDYNGCQAYDSKQVLILVSDIGVSDVILPDATCSGSEETIRVIIENFGNTNIAATANISVSFSVDGGEPVTEKLTLESPLGTGKTITHDFGGYAFTGTGEYSIKAWTTLSSDLKSENDTASATVFVNTLPNPDIGNGEESIVIRNPVMLDAGGGYASYIWQDGSTGQTFSIDEPVEGWFSVKVTDINNCSASDSLYVLYPLADLALTSIIAPLSDCELTDKETLGVEIWNNGGHPVPSGEKIMVFYRINNGPPVGETITLQSEIDPGAIVKYTFSTAADMSVPGTYDILAWLEYDSDGNHHNNSLTSKVHVYGNAVPDISGGADTLYSSLPVTLDPGTFEAYLWQDNSTGPELIVTTFGTYSVTVTDKFGCKGSDTVIIESPVSSGIPDLPEEDIRVWPNPVSEKLHVKIQSGQMQDNITLEIVNLRGMVMYTNVIKPYSFSGDEIDVRNFPKGMYVLRLSVNGKSATRTILVN
jgi:hypothetical protein